LAFKVFYSDYCEEKIVDSSDAFHASVSEIDVPMPEKNGSFCRAGSLQECLSIVKRLDKAVDVSKINGLEFQSW